jgi:ATP-dependent exoDNAse (exonuclease V) alpha subunit
MAIFHLHVKNISRGEGRSVVAAAAYRAGADLPNEAEQRTTQFGGRRGIQHTEIMLPPGAADWMGDRAVLWNRVEAGERRRDARLAKEVEVAIPRELSGPDRLLLIRRFAATFVARGHIVDFAIHIQTEDGNPHAHLLMTTRTIRDGVFGPKMREADGVEFVSAARKAWASLANAALAKSGASGSIDHRSHTAAGITREATKHRGPPMSRLEREKEIAPVQADREPEDAHPVPDPQGRPIAPADSALAEEAMIREMEQGADGAERWWRAREHTGSGEEPSTPQERERAEKTVLTEAERNVRGDEKWWLSGPTREPEGAPENEMRDREDWTVRNR